MKRTQDLRKGMRAVTAAMFLAAALASMGCSNNALMNPQQGNQAVNGQTANAAGHELNPAGHEVNP
ncbi:MAG TPA: hypothetical protein VJP78_08955 [Thermoleophilia bacterium]|nr:hypothetical protein [Thermoleophilia bacterium]